MVKLESAGHETIRLRFLRRGRRRNRVGIGSRLDSGIDLGDMNASGMVLKEGLESPKTKVL